MAVSQGGAAALVCWKTRSRPQSVSSLTTFALRTATSWRETMPGGFGRVGGCVSAHLLCAWHGMVNVWMEGCAQLCVCQ